MNTVRRILINITAITALLACSLSVKAMPMEYGFSYDFSPGKIVSGKLWGELQADMNTVLVTDFVAAYDTLVMLVEFSPYDIGFPQIASLDGSSVQLSGLTSTLVYSTLFTFQINSDSGASVGGVDIFSGSSISLENETFDAARWQLTALDPVATVPVPTSLLLLILGITALRFINARAVFPR